MQSKKLSRPQGGLVSPHQPMVNRFGTTQQADTDQNGMMQMGQPQPIQDRSSRSLALDDMQPSVRSERTGMRPQQPMQQRSGMVDSIRDRVRRKTMGY